LHDGRRSLIHVLKTVRDVFPDDQVIVLEQCGALKQVTGYVSSNEELARFSTHRMRPSLAAERQKAAPISVSRRAGEAQEMGAIAMRIAASNGLLGLRGW
jgi:hypothetical protein